MAVSSHLKIDLAEYDERIRTFIPDYEAMLDAAAAGLESAARPPRVLIDLGIGSGALAAKCLTIVPNAAIVGMDADPGMLAFARRRLADVPVTFVEGDFTRLPLPRCDSVTASFALHHIPTRRKKLALYRRAYAALRRGGLLINADCCPAANKRVAALDRVAWRRHLEASYERSEAEGFLRAWAYEDFYFRLDAEIAMLRTAGFSVDVPWRRRSFAVILALKR